MRTELACGPASKRRERHAARGVSNECTLRTTTRGQITRRFHVGAPSAVGEEAQISTATEREKRKRIRARQQQGRGVHPDAVELRNLRNNLEMIFLHKNLRNGQILGTPYIKSHHEKEPNKSRSKSRHRAEVET